MTRNLTHAFSRKSVSLFVSSRPHPQSPSQALRPGRSTRPTATRRRSRRRRPPPPFVFPTGRRPRERRPRRPSPSASNVSGSAASAAAAGFEAEADSGGSPGDAPPRDAGDGPGRSRPLSPRTRASASLPSGVAGGPRPPPASASCFSRRNAPGRYFCTSSWFTYPALILMGLRTDPSARVEASMTRSGMSSRNPGGIGRAGGRPDAPGGSAIAAGRGEVRRASATCFAAETRGWTCARAVGALWHAEGVFCRGSVVVLEATLFFSPT